MKKLLPIILILLVATVAFAQNRGRILGTITTAEGAVVSGVKITIKSDALIASTMTTTTNDRGTFRFVLLPVGTFDVTMEKEGYQTIEQKGLELGYEATLTLNKVMQTADFGEVITITGEAPIVDKTSTTIGDKLDTTFLQNQPNTRNVWALPNLTAGFTNNSGFGGVQSAGNSYNVDGLNMSDPATGTLGTSVNFEAVEQVDISLFGANAEHGAFTGAALNVVTKSGGNEFSGEANFYYQSTEWVGDNTENYDRISVPAATKLTDPNFELGGPVLKDKIWFIGSYNYNKDETNRSILTGPFTESYTRKRFFGKVSARWDDRNITYASFTWYDGSGDSYYFWPVDQWEVQRESTLWDNFNKYKTYQLQHSFVLSDDIILEGRVGRIDRERGSDPVGGAGFDTPLMFDAGDDFGHMANSSANRFDSSDRDRDSALLTMQYFNDDMAGTHSFKFGFEYEDSLNHRLMTINDLQVWYNGLSWYRYSIPLTDAGTVITRYAGFAQDSWSVNDKLTINYGIRFDRTGKTAQDPDVSRAGDDEFMVYEDLSPRAGFAYDLFGDGRTVLRAFAGRYFEGMISGNTEPMTGQVDPTYYYRGTRYGYADWTLISVSGGSNPNWAIKDGDLENTYTDGITVGIEHELMENIGISATFIYKKDHNATGEVSPDATWDPAENYSIVAQGKTWTGYYYPNFSSGARTLFGSISTDDVGVLEDPEREFYGFVLEFNKRMSDNWSLKANYTYSQNNANVGQGYGVIQGFSGYSDPNDWINVGGVAGLERPNVFKVSGTYIAPFDIYFSPAVTYMDGYALSNFITIDGVQILAEETTGDNRLDNQWNLDLRLEKAFVIMDRYRLGFILDVFNAFNDDAVTSMVSNDVTSTNYRIPDAVVTPRIVQVGVRLTF